MRWLAYVALGAVATVAIGPYLVIVLVVCGLTEVAVRAGRSSANVGSAALLPAVAGHAVVLGGLGALAWVALKVGALSFGGGFVIIPLMQHDAVDHVSLDDGGSVPECGGAGTGDSRPVVQTVAVVGYAAAGVVGGLFAAWSSSRRHFSSCSLGAPRFGRIRVNPSVQSFFCGAGPAAIGAIAGSAVSLGLTLQHLWQIPVLGAALAWFWWHGAAS